jgi:hypothetical protein
MGDLLQFIPEFVDLLRSSLPESATSILFFSSLMSNDDENPMFGVASRELISQLARLYFESHARGTVRLTPEMKNILRKRINSMVIKQDREAGVSAGSYLQVLHDPDSHPNYVTQDQLYKLFLSLGYGDWQPLNFEEEVRRLFGASPEDIVQSEVEELQRIHLGSLIPSQAIQISLTDFVPILQSGNIIRFELCDDQPIFWTVDRRVYQVLARYNSETNQLLPI